VSLGVQRSMHYVSSLGLGWALKVVYGAGGRGGGWDLGEAWI
jgi:hypothetical protein